MGAPACDRGGDDELIRRLWTPEAHRRCVLMIRMGIDAILLQNRHREEGFGKLPRELCLAILRRVPVYLHRA